MDRPFDRGSVAHVDYALVRCEAQVSAPAVILSHGLGTTFQKSWCRVFPEISRHHTVLAYNRAAYGRSAPVAGARDGERIVSELRELLQALGLPPPYVLVGHSMGGLYMQLFARRYPEEVAGLVLVDPTHPRQFEGLGDMALRPAWFRVGFHGFLRIFGGLDEWRAARLSGQQVMAAPPLPDKPVAVLVSGRPGAGHEASGIALHDHALKQDFLHIYPGCDLQWLDCGHDIPRERPAEVVDAINRICRAAVIQR